MSDDVVGSIGRHKGQLVTDSVRNLLHTNTLFADELLDVIVLSSDDECCASSHNDREFNDVSRKHDRGEVEQMSGGDCSSSLMSMRHEHEKKVDMNDRMVRVYKPYVAAKRRRWRANLKLRRIERNMTMRAKCEVTGRQGDDQMQSDPCQSEQTTSLPIQSVGANHGWLIHA